MIRECLFMTYLQNCYFNHEIKILLDYINCLIIIMRFFVFYDDHTCPSNKLQATQKR